MNKQKKYIQSYKT